MMKDKTGLALQFEVIFLNGAGKAIRFNFALYNHKWVLSGNLSPEIRTRARYLVDKILLYS